MTFQSIHQGESAQPNRSWGINLQAAGYSIQVGAFAKMDTAVRLSAVLAGKGVDAFYLKDQDGLFRIRIGDFRKMEEARAKAEELLSEGMIEDYYIVNPESSAATLAHFNGTYYLRNELNPIHISINVSSGPGPTCET